MQQKLFFVVFFASFCFLPLFISGAGRETLGGKWEPIRDLKDPKVVEVAEFAVSEYNKRTKAEAAAILKLNGLVKGEEQVVSGINYRLVLKATNGTSTSRHSALYAAVVWEKAVGGSKNLTSFKAYHFS